jgi:hemerythrin-like domain-containing protein
MDDPTKPDLRISYLEHRSMRADAALFTELVGAAGPADAGRLRALAEWYARYEAAIHDHHHAEEAVIYPALLERDPSFAEADHQLEGQHRVLADRLQVARESLTGLATAADGSRWEREREEAVKAAVALKAIVDTHTGDEEVIAFPRYAAHFSVAEYADLNKAAFRLVGRCSFVFAGPWVLDHASPSERAELLGERPLLLRVLYRLALRPCYQRLVRPLRQPTEPAHS